MSTMMLTDAVREVAHRHPQNVGERPLYQIALREIRNGRFPVKRRGRHLHVWPADLPLLAELLELAPREPVEPDRAA